jgi:hypothetical protein
VTCDRHNAEVSQWPHTLSTTCFREQSILNSSGKGGPVVIAVKKCSKERNSIRLACAVNLAVVVQCHCTLNELRVIPCNNPTEHSCVRGSQTLRTDWRCHSWRSYQPSIGNLQTASPHNISQSATTSGSVEYRTTNFALDTSPESKWRKLSPILGQRGVLVVNGALHDETIADFSEVKIFGRRICAEQVTLNLIWKPRWKATPHLNYKPNVSGTSATSTCELPANIRPQSFQLLYSVTIGLMPPIS